MTFEYKRTAYFHETDQMGIIHHTNYIKWFEEARIALMTELGIPYTSLEERGISIPVLHVSCDYKKMVRFDQEVVVHTSVDKYNGVRLGISYEVKDVEGETVFVKGASKHCFLNSDMRPVTLEKAATDFHKVFLDMCR